MAKVPIFIPEESVPTVVAIIRAGIEDAHSFLQSPEDQEVVEALEKWCEDQQT